MIIPVAWKREAEPHCGRCGHTWFIHAHYRRGSDCGVFWCRCRRYRVGPPWWRRLFHMDRKMGSDL